MALDSLGNPQVDFAWGNMPLQGNTERGVVVPVTRPTYGYQNDWDNVGGMFSIDLTSATQVEAGWIITATAGPAASQITREFTVESVSMGSPGYYVRTKEAFDSVFWQAGAVGAGMYSTSIAPALNRGGGAGDKGWSQTTLVKSPNLDPTLDNHTLATSGWNGYPGYKPGVSVVTLLEHTSFDHNGMGSTGWSVQNHATQNDSGVTWFNGFTLTVADPMGLGIEDLVADWSALKAAIDANTLSGADITINNWTSQYGTPDFNGINGKLKVIGGWYYVDSYGNNALTLSIVPTVPGDKFGLNEAYMFSGQLPVGVSLTITERTALPTLQLVQDDSYPYWQGGDAFAGTINWMNYDGSVQVYVGNGIPTEQLATLTTNAVGKTVGMGFLSADSLSTGSGGNAAAYDVVKSVFGPTTDFYGNQYYTIETEHGFAIGGVNAYHTGDTLVIL